MTARIFDTRPIQARRGEQGNEQRWHWILAIYLSELGRFLPIVSRLRSLLQARACDGRNKCTCDCFVPGKNKGYCFQHLLLLERI